MTVKLLYTSNCSRTVPISYTSTVTTFPQTLGTYRKHNRSTSKPRSQQKHLSAPCIVHKSPTLFSKCNWRLNSSQSYSPLHQLCLYRAKKKKNYLPPFSLKPLLLEKIKVIRSADQTLRQLRESDQMFYATKMAN